MGCGIVKRNRGKSEDLPDSFNKINQRWCFCVRKLDDLINIIIPLFDKYPLQSQKRLDYEDLTSGACLIKDGKHLTPEGLDEIRLTPTGVEIVLFY